MNKLPQKNTSVPQVAITQELTEAAIRNKTMLIRGGAVVVGFGALVILAPFVGTAITAGAGFIALGVMVVAGIGLMQALPLVGQKWENKVLAMRKQEARDNPTEQLDNRVIFKRQQFNQAKEALGTILGYMNGLARMINDEKKVDPDHDVTRLEKSLKSMGLFIEKKAEKLKIVEEKLIEFEKNVKRWKFEHKFAEQGRVALNSINEMEGKDVTEEILTDEAITAIEGNFDSLFGEIDLEALLAQASDLRRNNPELIAMDDDIGISEVPTMTSVKERRR